MDQRTNSRHPLEDAIRFLRTRVDFKVVSKDMLTNCFQVIEQHAREEGLEANQIQTLVDVIRSKNLVSKDIGKIINMLIPKTFVPINVAIGALFCVCNINFPRASKVVLLKWLVSVWWYDLLENANDLHCMYDLIFTQIVDESLCPYVCFMLHKLTQRQDVVTFRIEQLDELLERYSHLPHLVCLWNHYATFKPDIKPIEGKAAYPTIKIWDDYFAATRVRNKQPVLTTERKKRKREGGNGVVVCRLKTMNDLNKCVHEAKHYMSIPEVISSPLNRLIYTSSDNDQSIKQFQFWFTSVMNQVWHSENPKPFAPNLKMLRNLFNELPGMFCELTMFLSQHMRDWDGHKLFIEMLSFLPSLTPDNYDDFATVLHQLHELFPSRPVNVQYVIIQQLTKLYCNLLFHEDLINDSLQPPEAIDNFLFLLSKEIDTLCVLCLQLNPRHQVVVLDLTLEFYLQAYRSMIVTNNETVFLPSAIIVSQALFSLSSFIVCKLCDVFILLQQVLKRMSRDQTSEMQEMIVSFNIYIADIMRCLWDETAFEPHTKTKIFISELPEEVLHKVQHPKSMFSVYCHPALAIFIDAFMENKNVSSLSYFKRNTDLKLQLVEHFRTENLGPLVQFLKHFHKF